VAIKNSSPTNLGGSTSLFDTFGNEVKRTRNKDVLVQYLENSTVNFVLPEASTEILSKLYDTELVKPAVDPYLLQQVIRRLVIAGYAEASARTMADVLMQTARKQGVNPLTYFDMSDNTVKLTSDTYEVINALMPKGHRINVLAPKSNSRNKNVFTAK
jgi:hypothetical protein